jgi:hypothetical protein
MKLLDTSCTYFPFNSGCFKTCPWSQKTRIKRTSLRSPPGSEDINPSNDSAKAKKPSDQNSEEPISVTSGCARDKPL